MMKNVLLARPHPFIVQEMKPLLEQCHYSVLKPDCFADIGAQAKRSGAALISLAVVSSIDASVEKVVDSVLDINPKLPIIFAALLPFDVAATTIADLLDKKGINAQIVGVSNSDQYGSLERVDTPVLYLSKSDLTDQKRREITKQLLLRHIG
ncbi:hypothetical protein Q2E61_16035 [Microbulbifer thermotolerans]|uniref:hypothetical protein n=1 Tax=Microbulbifer thermotolerans TaxID=252514 RepID=UPI002671563D|nr:hypothetical protein [Microbulbifer thermotolerans]WKT60399.1 hypothetical protein Q2E61_16035 [Microbulbifer thermotolerans]